MIEAIFVASDKGSAPIAVREVQLIAGKGIVGDRNFARQRWPGQNLTLIEAEEIERFNAVHARKVQASETRRNLITRGVRLNELVGQRFRIGEVLCFGVELCEPCRTLGSLLATTSMLPPQIVKAWVHKAGLRVDVLTGGVIRVGTPIIADAAG